MQFCLETYDIEQGILRCGDDLQFNESLLKKFLNIPNKRYHYMGNGIGNRSYINFNPDNLKITQYDPWMIQYYRTHKEDFDNPLHNLKGIDIQTYSSRPKVAGAEGTLYYLSRHACDIIVQWMKSIDWDIFHFDPFSQSYPYTIEDRAVAYILYRNHIDFIHTNIIVSNRPNPRCIAYHTNYVK